ncbi:DUF202 domain-containing protein [Isoptericola sediminis]|uniref:DUF202 domain-containing protein n=1 Tax=Isoptericola sediminis TaxID=2733572 RepID=A0A849K6M1_9MICO|nr:DUF202 domain-containing protein [Isoptericola sediminis]NNU28090.1 DUF202 domain-containing protein [Isoptericola sediminis]
MSAPSAPDPAGPEVPGRWAERTALAWRRTLMSFAAATLVAIHAFPAVQGAKALAGAAVVALVLVTPGWWFTARHARHTRAGLEQEVPRLRHGRRIVTVCAATSLLALGALLLVLLA